MFSYIFRRLTISHKLLRSYVRKIASQWISTPSVKRKGCFLFLAALASFFSSLSSMPTFRFSSLMVKSELLRITEDYFWQLCLLLVQKKMIAYFWWRLPTFGSHYFFLATFRTEIFFCLLLVFFSAHHTVHRLPGVSRNKGKKKKLRGKNLKGEKKI